MKTNETDYLQIWNLNQQYYWEVEKWNNFFGRRDFLHPTVPYIRLEISKGDPMNEIKALLRPADCCGNCIYIDVEEGIDGIICRKHSTDANNCCNVCDDFKGASYETHKNP